MTEKTQHILNWIDGGLKSPGSGDWIDKFNPHSGKLLFKVANSSKEDVNLAISAAAKAYAEWSALTPVARGQILNRIVDIMKHKAKDLAECIAVEAGKPPQDARGEVGAAIMQGEYFAGEGMRLYGRTLTSAMPGKYSHTVRQPRGVAGLIVPANTPIANIAWKSFPALICGNTVILKAAEDTPRIAQLFAEIASESGMPAGVFNVVQGAGATAGAAIVEDRRVEIISFTGSTSVGRWIAEVGGKRLARISLELGGKNPFVVCDDADIDLAVHWATLSAFSNAGQRCAAGSRVLVFDKVYDEFREKFVRKTRELRLGVEDGCDLGPVINRRQQQSILSALEAAKSRGANILCGGGAPTASNLTDGFYIEPTIIDGAPLEDEVNCKELFGPVVTLNPVSTLQEALSLANNTEYGLTAAIHTKSVDRAMWFAQRVRAGVANINLGTYGSEPHMPFGGFGASGNGSREPGVEALDVYSELKNISFLTRESFV
jgi:acyl-CoA reductase-like NAD-dependent aldehyde dehydrogenase